MCLMDATRLHLDIDTAERIARQAWNDCIYLWRRHVHPRIASRLIWTLLTRVPHSDELVLEFLALEPSDRKRPMMGPEEIVGLLTSRPLAPISERLKWVLIQLARNDDTSSWLALGSLASLILAENNSIPIGGCLHALVRLLGHDHWPRDGRGTLADRASRLLQSFYDTGCEAADKVRSALDVALRSEEASEERGDRTACAAAKLLIGLGVCTEPDPLEILVSRGLLKSYWKNEETVEDLVLYLRDDDLRPRVVKAITAGLNSPMRSIRTACARILRTLGTGAYH